MQTVEFKKGMLRVNGYEFVVRNGFLKDQYSKSELENLDKMNPHGMASIPYRQRTLLVGQFSPKLNGLDSVLSGEATFDCLTAENKPVSYRLNLFGKLNEDIVTSIVESHDAEFTDL